MYYGNMKKIMFIFLIILGLNSCSKNSNSKIIGVWEILDSYNGLREITFTKNNMNLKQYSFGEYPDLEINREYTIIDNIIFIKNSNTNEYYYDAPFYIYSIIGNKLHLSGYYGEIYTKKVKVNIQNVKNNILGKWSLQEENKYFDFIFSEKNVNIIEYNEYGNIIKESNTTYELDEYYIKINDLYNISEFIFRYDNTYLYKISKNALIILKTGGGEREPKMFYLIKQ
jgi:hypothetical protein